MFHIVGVVVVNIVYKLTFIERLREGKKPYYYIGSKSKCSVTDGVIYDKNGKPYFGSSKYEGYKELVETSSILLDVLFVSEKYKDVLLVEANTQKEVNADTSPEYFNLSIANTKSCFTMPNYASMKHKDDYSKKVRLPIDHPLVLDGTYIGLTYGHILTEEERKKKGRAGDKNPFFGKKHTEETKQKIRDSNTGRKQSIESRKKRSDSQKGVSKSEEHKRKIGRKGMVTLKCPVDLVTVRVYKNTDEHNKYISMGYLNPYTIKLMNEKESITTCPYCEKSGNNNSSFKRWHFDNCKKKEQK